MAALNENLKGVLSSVIDWLNPVVGSPSAPLETAAYIDSFGASLMPHKSVHQGFVAGANVLAARGITGIVDGATRKVVPSDAALGWKLAARAATGAVGQGLASIPQEEGETMYRASARASGRLVRAASAGGAIYDVGIWLRERYPAQRAIRPIAGAVLGTAGVAYWAGRRLTARREEIQRWPIPQKNTLPGGIATGAVVTVVGHGMAKGFIASRNGLIRYMGPGITKNVLARVANAGLWGLGFTALYNAGIAKIGTANEKIEPGYATPPDNPEVSGPPDSLSPFEDLGQQGRRYVTDVVTPELIEEVMGEPAVAHPLRVYVGFNSEPVYQTGRAEIALAELDRTNALDRSFLLLVSPTGTGWVDQTMIEAAELMTRGDIATACIQYGRYPSFLALQKVSLGQAQFRLLLWGVKQRLAERPPERRPKVLVFGESLGAWSSSDVVMFQGIKGFDHYGIDRALWVGLPWLAKWSRSGMTRGASDLVPEGTVHVFDHHDQLAELTAEEQDRLRAIILSHDNDPIAHTGPDLAVQRPYWLGEERGRNVPESMEWIPLITFWQTVMDAANAMVTVPGEFGSFGHDYRADMARFVRDAYQLPATSEEQTVRVDEMLKTLELERAERIKALAAETAPPAPSQREDGERRVAGVPLVAKKSRGASWRKSLSRGTLPAGDLQ
jgi:uncharacterized membrane protein